ncbi:hypothetical protein [Endozoicomonas ascidiicola]|uniref:hypothetical protein n=1 Tax=Endozoicomonas ascidiicola TaxID=1698521 RepID=UPI000834CDE0|nr:hypothetical protein [Endozoicomonas ascidiicola]USN27003.1 hypothetical protein [synthetic construct]
MIEKEGDLQDYFSKKLLLERWFDRSNWISCFLLGNGGTGSVSALELSKTKPSIAIAISAGGVSILNTFKKYQTNKQTN